MKLNFRELQKNRRDLKGARAGCQKGSSRLKWRSRGRAWRSFSQMITGFLTVQVVESMGKIGMMAHIA
jgi:hypothetical protein